MWNCVYSLTVRGDSSNECKFGRKQGNEDYAVYERRLYSKNYKTLSPVQMSVNHFLVKSVKYIRTRVKKLFLFRKIRLSKQRLNLCKDLFDIPSIIPWICYIFSHIYYIHF